MLIFASINTAQLIDGDAPNETLLYIGSFAYAVACFFYLQGYLNLAWLFKEVSVEMPVILKNKNVTMDQRSERRLYYNVFSVLNVLITAFVGIVYALGVLDPSKLIEDMNDYSILIFYFLLVLYGSITINSIRKTTKYLEENEIKMNMWLIQLAKKSFYIFIIAEVLNATFYTVFIFNPTSHNEKQFLGFAFYFEIAQFVS
jgi:hypothetical protein